MARRIAAREQLTWRCASLWTALAALTITVGGCAAQAGPSDKGDGAVERVAVKVGGHTLHVEPALKPEVRYKGLSFRDHIPPDEGMLFVFPSPQQLTFVMRDCLVPIDIAFLDAAGRVVAMHEMQIEPRKEDEADDVYEARLKRYPSRYRALFALETAGGRLKELGLRLGDKVQFDFDVNALKRRAQ